MAQAAARHILVKTEAECNDLVAQIKDGASFAELAKKFSKCPSGRDWRRTRNIRTWSDGS